MSGYYISSASRDNLAKYAEYVETCIATNKKPLTYSKWMTDIVVPSVLNKR